jgi:peptide/nickel transport system permease protein
LVWAASSAPLDEILMRIADRAISYPVILLALLLAVTFGQRGSNVVIAISAFLWPTFARVVRGEVLLQREMAYVSLARIAGASTPRIIVRHILPNIGATIAVLASLSTGNIILAESGLSFLGAGVPAPAPAWGGMAAVGRDHVTTAWWLSALPSLAILSTVLSLKLFGDWLRDRLDPKLSAL